MGGSRVLEKGGFGPQNGRFSQKKAGFGPNFHHKMPNFHVILKKFHEKGVGGGVSDPMNPPSKSALGNMCLHWQNPNVTSEES